MKISRINTGVDKDPARSSISMRTQINRRRKGKLYNDIFCFHCWPFLRRVRTMYLYFPSFHRTIDAVIRTGGLLFIYFKNMYGTRSNHDLCGSCPKRPSIVKHMHKNIQYSIVYGRRRLFDDVFYGRCVLMLIRPIYREHLNLRAVVNIRRRWQPFVPLASCPVEDGRLSLENRLTPR